MMTRRTALAGLAATGLVASAARANVGFHMPEESAPHLRTFMQWPVNRKVHPDPVFLRMLQRAIADIANAIAEFEPVVMLMAAEHAAKARRKLSGDVEIWDVPTDDLWCRDSGPTFLNGPGGTQAVTHFNFNGWGGKQVHGADGQIAARVAERLGLPVVESGVVGEAGGLESDGAGTLIAHESSWVNPNRNALPRHEIGARLTAVLGAEKIIWAPGIAGADITDYHIDALARFARPGVIAIQLPEKIDPEDPWSRAAFETYDILRGARDAAGRRFEFVTLPEPAHPRIRHPEFVAAYVNYYVCNGAVIAAQFGDPEADAQAESALRGLYPGREIVMLNVDPVGETGGGIHCATQQQPKP